MIDKKQLTIKNYYLISSVLVFFTLILSSYSYFNYKNILLEPDYEKQRRADFEECLGFLSSKQLDAKKLGGNLLIVTSNQLNSPPKVFLSSIESTLLACRNFEMDFFCFGDESQCGSGNLFKMTLNYKLKKD
jgi:hypothetical protein